MDRHHAVPITIDGIFSSPIASGRMVSHPSATLVKGVGLKGDRYAARAGTYSVLTAEPGRQLTLISKEGVKRVFSEHGIQWYTENHSLGDLRRNILLQGISSDELLSCIGSVLELGSGGAKIFVHRNCVPCMYNERKNQTKGLMEALWDSGGVSCEVIEGGEISVGETVTINSNHGYGIVVDDGQKPSSFYIRPSKRTAEMVRKALQGKRRAHE